MGMLANVVSLKKKATLSEPIGKTGGQVAAQRKQKMNHVPPPTFTQRPCSTPAFVPHFGLDLPNSYLYTIIGLQVWPR
jgi:hypothetical protein